MTNRASWANNSIFYHIYPLGLLGAPMENDFTGSPVNRLIELQEWIPHIRALGCNALYLGPVFESDFHGYDTADYFHIDRRLGTNQTLKDLSHQFHENGIKLVLDTVFNHVGRNFRAFKDLQANGEDSQYKDWFSGVDFNQKSVYGDNFSYEGWYDAYNLVKLNLTNVEVKTYLFSAVAMWMDEFNIDGLRLDVAEIMDKQFLAELAAFCRARHNDFWLMGEVINGNYNDWANPDMLDSTTNYEAYKGLYSSHNDSNYFEIAHTLNRQFGEGGIYNNLMLYNFADNHDTTRVFSILNNKAHFFPLHVLLFTMPGIPSVYYGSEWGIQGIKGEHDDYELRPRISSIPDLSSSPVFIYLRQLARIRQEHEVLQHGSYRQLYVDHQQFIFWRKTADELMIIAVNASENQADVLVHIDEGEDIEFRDILEPGYAIHLLQQELQIDGVPANGARILTANRITKPF